MRAFQTVVSALLAISSANGQIISGAYRTYGSGLSGLSLGSSLYGYHGVPAISYGGGYSTIAAAPAISYGGGYSTIAAAPAVSRVIAAPAVSTVGAVSAPIAARVATVAAPAVSTISAAPAISTVHSAPAVSAVAAAPVNVGVIGTVGTPSVRSHEIHTGSGNQAIRIEDFQAGDQVIRVHEGPQAAPQIAQVAVPGDQHHVRVVEHPSGPAHVERVVSRAPTQVIDVAKPGRPSARIVQVIKGESPAPSIEFVSAGGPSHHVYYADDVNAGGVIGGTGLIGGTVVSAPVATRAVSVAAAPAVSTIATPVATHVAAAPASSSIVHAAPAVSSVVHAAPALSSVVHAVPAVSSVVHAVPAVSSVVHAAPAISNVVHAAPAVSYASYAPISYGTAGLGGFTYGGLGYSTGYNAYGLGGHSLYLDAKKKASAKKSA